MPNNYNYRSIARALLLPILLSAAPAAAQVNLTFPTASDTILGRATIDTVLNKSISGVNNTLNVRLGTSDVSGINLVANGGIGTGTASGTALDNITGFASTGILQRTGAGTYAFLARSGNTTTVATTSGALASGHTAIFDASGNIVDGGTGGSGTVTSVGLSVPATSIFAVTGSPVTGSGTLGLTTTGTSGGIPYFSSGTQLASSAALTANLPVIGQGAGAAPTVGTRSGNTTAFVTTTGAQTSGKCVTIDASGNHVADAAACGGTGGWNLTDGTHPLTGVTALTVDGSAFVVGGTAGAATLALNANGVPNSKLATMADKTIKGNFSGGTATPVDVSVAAVRSGIGIDSRISSYGAADSSLGVTDYYVTLGSSTWGAPHTYKLPAISTVNDGRVVVIADDLSKLNGQVLTLAAATASGDTVAGTTAMNAAGGVLTCRANTTATTWSCWGGLANSQATGQLCVGQGTGSPCNWVTIGSNVALDNLGNATVSGAGVMSFAALTAGLPSNRLIYTTTSTTLGGLTSVNDSVLTTNGSGVPTYVSQVPKTKGGTGSATGVGAAQNLSHVYKLFEDNTGVTVTGVTAETQVASCPVPAGAMGSSGSLRIYAVFSRPTAQTSATAVSVRFGAANDLTGTVVHSALSMGSTVRVGRLASWQLDNRSASSQFSINSLGNTATSTSDTSLTAAINTANASYLNLSVTPVTSGDTIKLEAFTCELLPPGGN